MFSFSDDAISKFSNLKPLRNLLSIHIKSVVKMTKIHKKNMLTGENNCFDFKMLVLIIIHRNNNYYR